MLKQLIRKSIHSLGFDLQRIENSGRSSLQTHNLLRASNSEAILDVGANMGQFALEVLEIDPALKIVSFEPVSTPHQLATESSKNYINWEVFDRTAVGNVTGEISINVAGNSCLSSSIYEMLPAHTNAIPGSAIVRQEKAPIIKLEQFVRSRKDMPKRLLLKIDTQGFELEVLKGAESMLEYIVAIQLELSWTELYAGQPLALETMQWILQRGFVPFGFLNGFRDPHSKRLLQVDGFFIREIQST